MENLNTKDLLLVIKDYDNEYIVGKADYGAEQIVQNIKGIEWSKYPPKIAVQRFFDSTILKDQLDIENSKSFFSTQYSSRYSYGFEFTAIHLDHGFKYYKDMYKGLVRRCDNIDSESDIKVVLDIVSKCCWIDRKEIEEEILIKGDNHGII